MHVTYFLFSSNLFIIGRTCLYTSKPNTKLCTCRERWKRRKKKSQKPVYKELLTSRDSKVGRDRLKEQMMMINIDVKMNFCLYLSLFSARSGNVDHKLYFYDVDYRFFKLFLHVI